MGEKNPFRDKRVFWEKKERKRGMGNDELVMRLRSHKCIKRKKKKRDHRNKWNKKPTKGCLVVILECLQTLLTGEHSLSLHTCPYFTFLQHHISSHLISSHFISSNYHFILLSINHFLLHWELKSLHTHHHLYLSPLHNLSPWIEDSFIWRNLMMVWI